MTNEIKLNNEIIGKNGIRFKTRLIETKDIDKIVEIVNCAYGGKDGTQPWTTQVGLVLGLRATPEMIQDDLDKDNSLIKMILVEHILEKQSPQDGADVESDQKENNERIIIGCVKIERDTIESKEASIGMLSVDPSYQGYGIGSFLMTLAEQEIINWGIKESHLHVVNLRHTLIAWYNKIGYKTTTTTYPFEFKGVIALKEIYFVLLVKKLLSSSSSSTIDSI